MGLGFRHFYTPLLILPRTTDSRWGRWRRSVHTLRDKPVVDTWVGGLRGPYDFTVMASRMPIVGELRVWERATVAPIKDGI